MSRHMDRQSNPVQNQGAVYTGADVDSGAKNSIQARNRDLGPSLYGGAEDDRNFQFTGTDLVFAVPGENGSAAGTKLAVLPALNGLGALATSLYPNDPEMVREAVKNKIQFIGAAYQAADGSGPNAKLGVNVQMGGLKTLPMGYGDGPNYIKPGDLVCAEVPAANRITKTLRASARDGVPSTKITLQLRRCSSTSAGESLRRHIRAILEDPTKWKMAMGERLVGTAIWETAAHEVMNSYLAGGLLLLRQAIVANIMTPVLGVLPLLNVGGAAAGFAIGASAAARAEAADTVVAALAKLMGVIDGQRSLTSRLRSSVQAESKLLALRMNVLQRIFYDGSNPSFEFAHNVNATGAHVYAGRMRDNKGINMSDDKGKFLDVQLNHAPRAVSGFHAAILNDLRSIVGKAGTGASSHGSGNCHVFMGVARQ